MMTTNEGPMRWRIWGRFRLSEKLLGGRHVHFNNEFMSIRFLLSFAFFFPFTTALKSLDEVIQAKKFVKGCNEIVRGDPYPNWGDL